MYIQNFLFKDLSEEEANQLFVISENIINRYFAYEEFEKIPIVLKWINETGYNGMPYSFMLTFPQFALYSVALFYKNI